VQLLENDPDRIPERGKDGVKRARREMEGLKGFLNLAEGRQAANTVMA